MTGIPAKHSPYVYELMVFIGENRGQRYWESYGEFFTIREAKREARRFARLPQTQGVRWGILEKRLVVQSHAIMFEKKEEEEKVQE